jgi:hypothetical protein
MERLQVKRARLVTLVVATWIASTASGLESPVLESDTAVATAGFYRLQWEPAAVGGGYELQESTRPDFSDARMLYAGPDLATVLSGKPDGDYYYRVRGRVDGGRSPWSAPVQVRVQAHSLGRALTFFALGALVFVATVALILRGEMRSRRLRSQ